MNEKIKELIKEAGFSDDFIDDPLLSIIQQKFAVLIIGEVISAYNDDEYQTEYEQDIKVLKHFGIEE